jgi:hypothetical protein
MRKIIIFIIFQLSLVNPSQGEDFTTEHEFNSGDVISADVFNELFSQIELVLSSVEDEYLFGSWECKSLFVKLPSTSLPAGWVLHTSQLFYELTGSQVTFSEGAQNKISTTNPNPFAIEHPAGTMAVNTTYALEANALILNMPGLTSSNSSHPVYMFNVKKISENRFVATPGISDALIPQRIQCERLSSVPAVPLSPSVTQDGSATHISWIDTSDNENGFNIHRRTGSTGNFQIIDSTFSNSNSYTDNSISLNETYYYRIAAFNDNGESSASKVVFAVVNDEAPYVVSTSPSNGETGVSGSCVSITFNEPMTEIDVNFILAQDPPFENEEDYLEHQQFQGDANSVVITGCIMEPFYIASNITVIINGSESTDLNGTPMLSNHTWSFTPP